MSATLNAGRQYTCLAYLDVPSLAAVEGSGRDLGTLNQSIVASLATLGVAANNYTEGTRNAVVADTLNITCNLSPSRNVTTRELDAAILNGANGGRSAAELIANPRSTFSPHVDRGTVGGLIITVLTAGFSGSTFVIDESTLMMGSSTAPPPSSGSALGRLAQTVTGAETVSQNPNRNGLNPSQNNMNALPWYVYLAIVAGGVAVTAVLAGYTYRSFK